MFLQILTYAWILSVVAAVLLLLLAVGRLVYGLISGNPITWAESYSFKWLPKFAVTSLVIAALISALVYWSNASVDVTISIYAFMMVCIVAGIIRSSLTEYHIKRRGGEEI